MIISLLLILLVYTPLTTMAFVPGVCEGERAPCDDTDIYNVTDCARIPECTVGTDGMCEGPELLCDTLAYEDCESLPGTFCSWTHTCDATAVTETQETSDPCGDCLETCRTVPNQSCTRDGTFCASDCSGGGGPITTTNYVCPAGKTRMGDATDGFGCCPSSCTTTNFRDFEFDTMTCFCDANVCGTNGQSPGGTNGQTPGGENTGGGESFAPTSPRLWVVFYNVVACTTVLTMILFE